MGADCGAGSRWFLGQSHQEIECFFERRAKLAARYTPLVPLVSRVAIGLRKRSPCVGTNQRCTACDASAAWTEADGPYDPRASNIKDIRCNVQFVGGQVPRIRNRPDDQSFGIATLGCVVGRLAESMLVKLSKRGYPDDRLGERDANGVIVESR